MTSLASKNRVQSGESQPDAPNIIAGARIASGMNAYLDPADIDPGVLTVAKNAEVRGDRTYRTPGSANITQTAPNSTYILLYTSWKRFSGVTEYLRFTKNDVYRRGVSNFSAVTGTLTGTVTDRFRWMVISDASSDYFLFTNGVDKIQKVNTGVTAFADLGTAAPKAKYICGFFNRVVAANITGASPNPTLMQWSGDLNFSEWNPSNDISAGSTPLVEAQADYSDEITGLFSFAAVMLILRERSLWFATKQPVASNPFQFQAAFPSVGCDTPSSATQTRNGICWYDGRANQVYYYELGGSPQPVGDAVRDLIAGSITDSRTVQAAFDSYNNTYILTVPSNASTTTRIFKLNLTNGAWTYDEKINVAGTFFLDSGTASLVIDDLAGYIDGLSGMIDSLAGTASVPHITYGMSTGALEEQSDLLDGGTMVLESKVFRGQTDTYVSRLMLMISPRRSGTMSVYYRRNGGNWTLYKTVTLGMVNSRQRVYCVKTLLCNDFQWKIECATGDVAILEYKIEAVSQPEDK